VSSRKTYNGKYQEKAFTIRIKTARKSLSARLLSKTCFIVICTTQLFHYALDRNKIFAKRSQSHGKKEVYLCSTKLFKEVFYTYTIEREKMQDKKKRKKPLRIYGF